MSELAEGIPMAEGNQSDNAEVRRALGTDAVNLNEKQLGIINKLSPRLVEELAGHLSARQIDEKTIAPSRGKNPRFFTEEDEQICAFGWLFERLVEAELFADEKDPVADELLAFNRDPSRYGVNDIGRMKNPDVVRFEVDAKTRTIIITGADEIKLGLLDYRASRQLAFGGFEESLAIAARSLNRHQTEWEKMGLANLANEGDKVAVADNFRQTLFVSADRAGVAVSSKGKAIGVRELIDEESFTNSDQLGRFVRSLRRQIEKGNLTIVKSSFGGRQVGIMGRNLYAEVKKWRAAQSAAVMVKPAGGS